MTDWESLSGRDLDRALAPYAGWTDIKDSWSSADNPPFLVGKWRGGVQAVIPQYHASIEAVIRDLLDGRVFIEFELGVWWNTRAYADLRCESAYADDMPGSTFAEAIARAFGAVHEKLSTLA